MKRLNTYIKIMTHDCLIKIKKRERELRGWVGDKLF